MRAVLSYGSEATIGHLGALVHIQTGEVGAEFNYGGEDVIVYHRPAREQAQALYASHDHKKNKKIQQHQQ